MMMIIIIIMIIIKSLYLSKDRNTYLFFQVSVRNFKKVKSKKTSLPANVLWGSFVMHSFLPHGEMNV